MRVQLGTVAASAALSVVALAPDHAGAASAPSINIPPAPLGRSLLEVGRQTGAVIVFDPALVRGLHANGNRGRMEVAPAIAALLEPAGLQYRQTSDGVFVIHRSAALAREDAWAPLRNAELQLAVRRDKIRTETPTNGELARPMNAQLTYRQYGTLS